MVELRDYGNFISKQEKTSLYAEMDYAVERQGRNVPVFSDDLSEIEELFK